MTKYSPRHAGCPTPAPVVTADAGACPIWRRRVWSSELRRPLLSGITTLAVVAAVSGGLAASSSGGSAVAGTTAAGTTVGAATVDSSVGALAEAERSQQAEAVKQAATTRSKTAAVRERAVAERRVTAARASRSRDRARLAAQNPQVSARSQVAARGWGAEQFSCLDSLWRKESGWKHTADNPTSSAFGIPQALPGSKMASAGSDWRTNPATQSIWAVGYMDDRYGSPCHAGGFKSANGWF